MAEEKWIGVSEAARLIHYHPEQIRRLARAGKVKARKVVIVWLVDRASVLTYKRQAEKRRAKTGPKR